MTADKGSWSVSRRDFEVSKGAMALTLIVEHGSEEQSQETLPDRKAIQDGGDETGWREELRRDRRVGGW